jgi:hypothetical protein
METKAGKKLANWISVYAIIVLSFIHKPGANDFSWTQEKWNASFHYPNIV